MDENNQENKPVERKEFDELKFVVNNHRHMQYDQSKELDALYPVDIGVTVQAYDLGLTQIANLADPNADRILFWDDSAGEYKYLAPGTGLSITDTTLNSSANSGIFGDGSDGSATISGNTSLSRDMYYTDLTINGGDLTTASYRIFVSGILTITSGVIKNNGNTGGAGGNGVNRAAGAGGAAGTALSAGSIPGGIAGVAGGAGGVGATSAGGNGANGNVGTVGLDSAPSWGVNGVASTAANGGDGGFPASGPNTPGTGAVSANGGTATAARNKYRTPNAIYNHIDIEASITQILSSAGSGGGGGGGGGASTTNDEGGGGGGGGGSGSTGGFVVIFAKTIVNNVAFGIQASGGVGGVGGNGAAGSGTGTSGGGGGGQGGNGGTGGVVLIVTQSYSGSGTITASGGVGGSGGTGGAGHGGGSAGGNGDSGVTGAAGVTVTITV